LSKPFDSIVEPFLLHQIVLDIHAVFDAMRSPDFWHGGCRYTFTSRQHINDPTSSHVKESLMKRIINILSVLAIMAALGVLFTQEATAQEKGTGAGTRSAQFIDQDGDGVCDNVGTGIGQKQGQAGKGKGYGPGDGTGNAGQGPKDGTGYGKRAGAGSGSGVCNGTGTGGAVGSGPKQNQARRGR
jgi:hypothetical protein